MMFSCMAGGVLGIAFIIPLRKQRIDFERLTFPGGVAVATILKSPGAYVNVMSCFAAGERYLNHVWSASADGYVGEVNDYLIKAQEQFVDSLDKVKKLC